MAGVGLADKGRGLSEIIDQEIQPQRTVERVVRMVGFRLARGVGGGTGFAGGGADLGPIGGLGLIDLRCGRGKFLLGLGDGGMIGDGNGDCPVQGQDGVR